MLTCKHNVSEKKTLHPCLKCQDVTIMAYSISLLTGDDYYETHKLHGEIKDLYVQWLSKVYRTI